MPNVPDDLIGKNVAEAKEALAAAGFTDDQCEWDFAVWNSTPPGSEWVDVGLKLDNMPSEHPAFYVLDTNPPPGEPIEDLVKVYIDGIKPVAPEGGYEGMTLEAAIMAHKAWTTLGGNIILIPPVPSTHTLLVTEQRPAPGASSGGLLSLLYDDPNPPIGGNTTIG